MANEYDPRIAMVEGYVPPPRPPSRTRRYWPWLLLAVLVFVVPPWALIGTEYFIARDPRLSSIERVTDYKPLATTLVVASTGETIARIGSVSRIVVPAAEMPKALAAALVAHVEPTFMTRDALGQRDLLNALRDQLSGKVPGVAKPIPLSLRLTRSLDDEKLDPADHGLVRLLQDYIAAIHLEHNLTREEIVQIYLNQLPFGGGGYGVEVAARARFGRSVGKLSGKELAELAASPNELGKAPPEPTLKAHECATAAIRQLKLKFPGDELDRMSGRIVTTCDLNTTAVLEDGITKRHLERMGLVANVAVMRLPSHELVGLVGAADQKHAIGILRAPFVIGSALASLKYNVTTPIGALSLRNATARSPAGVADALLTAGVSKAPVMDLAVRSGLEVPNPDAICDGRLPVTIVEAVDVLGTLATQGERAQPQLLRTLTRGAGGAPESLTTTSRLQAFTPEVAFLLSSLLSKPVRSPLGRPSAGLTGTEGADTWLGVYTPDLAIAVWLGGANGAKASRMIEIEKLAIAIAIDVVAAELKGKPATPFERAPLLFTRRVDDNGKILPRGTPGGSEDWFIPGSARREEMELAPEANPEETPQKPRSE